MIRSLRARLLVGITLTFVVILGLLGLAVDTALRRTLTAEFDNTLLTKAQALSSMVEQRRDRVKFEFDIQDMPEFDVGKRPSYFELWVDGKHFDQSPSLQNRSLFDTPPAVKATDFRNLSLPDSTRGRVVIMPFSPHSDEDAQGPFPKTSAVVLVARDTEDLDHTLYTVRWTIVTLCAAAVALAVVTLLIVVRQAIRPVNRVAAQIHQLRETALSTRIDIADSPDELHPIVRRLNELLERLEDAFNRERAFTADVAHELRTPIAALRTTLEVCRSRPRDAAVYAGVISRSLEVVNSMQTLIENLLLLARAESGQLPIVLADVDLVGLIHDTWVAFAPRAAQANLDVRWQMPDSLVLPSDIVKLRIILANLFDNAVSYANPGGTLDIVLNRTPQRTTFQVANTGNLVSPDEVPHLFKRFWRKDPARSQTGMHAGLGLSLCQRLLVLLNSTIVARTEGDRFIVELSLPAPVKTSHPPAPVVSSN